MTLFEMTNHESGIIVYPDGGVMVANWANCEDGCLPVLDPMGFGTLDMFEYDAPLDKDVTEESFKDALKLIPYDKDEEEQEINIDVIYDPHNDLTQLFSSKEKESGIAYTLSDGTKILAISSWC